MQGSRAATSFTNPVYQETSPRTAINPLFDGSTEGHTNFNPIYEEAEVEEADFAAEVAAQLKG